MANNVYPSGADSSGSILLAQTSLAVHMDPVVNSIFITNVLILTLENEFLEIRFGGRQNVFSTIFGTKFVEICAAEMLNID